MSDRSRRGPRLVVTLGTTHHPCDRVSAWLEAWLRANPVVVCVYQHGASRPVEGAECVTMLPRTELLDHQRGADVIVVQGGTGSVMDARSVGRRPIVVPRRPDLGEVVDDHQIVFGRRLVALSWAQIVETESDFAAAVSAAVADPESVRIPIEASPVSATARRLAEELDALPRSRAGFVSLRRIRQIWCRGCRRDR